MPRRSGGGGRPAPRAPARRPAPPPQKVHQAPPPAPVQPGGGGMMSGLGSTIAQGMAFGTGSAMAHRAVDSIMGPRTVQHEVAEAAPQAASSGISTVGAADVCTNQFKAFQDCLNASGNDIGRCQFYMDMLNECRKGPSTSVIL